MANQLRLLGISENKSLTFKFPECINDDLLPHFLRGFWDGDGFLEKKRYRTGCTGTQDFLSAIQLKMKRTLGVDFSIQDEYSKSGKTFTIKLSNKKDCMTFLNYIYKDSTIYLQRKYDIYKSYMNESLAA